MNVKATATTATGEEIFEDPIEDAVLVEEPDAIDDGDEALEEEFDWDSEDALTIEDGGDRVYAKVRENTDIVGYLMDFHEYIDPQGRVHPKTGEVQMVQNYIIELTSPAPARKAGMKKNQYFMAKPGTIMHVPVHTRTRKLLKYLEYPEVVVVKLSYGEKRAPTTNAPSGQWAPVIKIMRSGIMRKFPATLPLSMQHKALPAQTGSAPPQTPPPAEQKQLTAGNATGQQARA